MDFQRIKFDAIPNLQEVMFMPIKHVLNDGTVLKDIQGHTVDFDEKEDDKPDQDVERQSDR